MAVIAFDLRLFVGFAYRADVFFENDDPPSLAYGRNDKFLQKLCWEINHERVLGEIHNNEHGKNKNGSQF